MAQVFIANATGIEGFERYVVLKRIHAEQASNKSFVQMFLDEARLAASLHHQHIVQVHDIGQDGGEYFFTMEYVHGQDLRNLLKKVSASKSLVPVEHVITIMLAATAALHYAHEHRAPNGSPLNLVHRDISPSNILVGYDGSIKVVDFGIAKAATRTDQTKSGVLKGKVAYMSPEQCRGKSLDRRSDIYALGIVLYELLVARRLFKADSDFMTMSAIVGGRIPPPSRRRPDIAPELEAIVLKALAKSPADRYQTAHELRRALEQYASAAGLRTSTTALSDYLIQVFGHQPEPWLLPSGAQIEEDGPELTIDFDGSMSGVADVPTDPFEEGISSPKSSPIGKARNRAITSGPPLAAGTAGTPGTDSAVAVVQRGRWPVVVAMVVAVVGIGGFAAMQLGDDAPRAAERPVAAEPPVAEPPVAVPTPDPAPASGAAANTGSAEPVGSAGAPPPTGATTVETGSGSAANTASKKTKKRPLPKQRVPKQNQPKPTDVEWNSDDLNPN